MLQLRAALLFVALFLSAHASAEPPPAPLPIPSGPLGLGSECGLLLSCPWSGPFAFHWRLGGQLWIPGEDDPRPRMGVFGWATASASFWRWAEFGAVFSGRLANPDEVGLARGEATLLTHPITLWARVSPQVRDSGIAVAGEVQYQVGTGPFNGSGHFFSDEQKYAILIGHASRFTRASLSFAYQEADERRYGGLEGGASLWVQVPQIGLALGAEGLARIGAKGQDRTLGWTATVGVRISDIHGMAFAAGYQWGRGPGLPAHGPIASFGASYGPGYVPHPKVVPERQPDGLFRAFMWLAGYRDPIIGADGAIWSDDGKRRLYQFGVRDPYHPGYIRPFRGGRPVAIGEHVMVRPGDGAVRTFTTAEFLGHALDLDTGAALEQALVNHRAAEEAAAARVASCPYCRRDPMPDYGPPNAGYMASCALVRWMSCGIKPWDLEALAAAPPRPPGGFLPRRWSFDPPGPWPHQVAAQQARASPPSTAPRVGTGPYANLPAPRLVLPGKSPTRMQSREIRQANTENNDGQLRDDYTGAPLVPAQQSRTGVTPPPNEAVIDHVVPRARGGDNSYSNLRVTSRKYNTEKGARPPTRKERR